MEPVVAPVLFLLFVLFVITFGLAAFAFWIWMIVDCAQNKRLNDSERIVWILVVIFLHILGALIYFAAGRKK